MRSARRGMRTMGRTSYDRRTVSHDRATSPEKDADIAIEPGCHYEVPDGAP